MKRYRGRLVLHSYGLGARDEMVAGIGPRDEGSVVQRGRPSKADSYGEVKRLSTIQRELGH